MNKEVFSENHKIAKVCAGVVVGIFATEGAVFLQDGRAIPGLVAAGIVGAANAAAEFYKYRKFEKRTPR